MAERYSFFGFLLKKAIFKNKMFHLSTKRRRVYWYRTLYVSVRNKVFKLIKHALVLNYRTLNLTIMALHVYLGDEPLTEGIKRCLMRVKGMNEKTWKRWKSAFLGKTLHTNSGKRTTPLRCTVYGFLQWAQSVSCLVYTSNAVFWCFLVYLYTKNGWKSMEVVYTSFLKDMHSAIRRIWGGGALGALQNPLLQSWFNRLQAPRPQGHAHFKLTSPNPPTFREKP